MKHMSTMSTQHTKTQQSYGETQINKASLDILCHHQI